MDKILVVDDDFDILTLVKMSLSLHGFQVEAIPRWEDVDRTIARFWPDLVLLDISLAGADGREICRKIKSDDVTKDIPVVLFSANADMEKSMHSCNAQAFIAKPYELQHLLDTIRSTIDKNKPGPTGEQSVPVFMTPLL
jgi:DNA-binding response OmpR family regulator